MVKTGHFFIFELVDIIGQRSDGIGWMPVAGIGNANDQPGPWQGRVRRKNLFRLCKRLIIASIHQVRFSQLQAGAQVGGVIPHGLFHFGQ